MRTNKGELTISASDFVLLNKTLQPLPEKYHGLVDQEVKYRQRYLDLIMSSETRARFRARSDLIQKIRTFFVDRGYLEVETPMMHQSPEELRRDHLALFIMRWTENCICELLQSCT